MAPFPNIFGNGFQFCSGMPSTVNKYIGVSHLFLLEVNWSAKF
jgi:hypothetical protein